ncbi:hypothetical protein HAX54_006233 [Datura stramonium]|uniref:RWD domain-containing protein n=1 Tax=Datura stramonium TaxID=4076 RepID=A0ABS8T9Z3_DATST|nr:hypothetical protein [Datura stramonium]
MNTRNCRPVGCAIFQEDCEVVSKSPSQIHIKLRPYQRMPAMKIQMCQLLLSSEVNRLQFCAPLVALLSILLWVPISPNFHPVCIPLHFRCLPGYPYKCPKLQLIPEKGLSKADASNLLSLLYDQVENGF